MPTLTISKKGGGFGCFGKTKTSSPCADNSLSPSTQGRSAVRTSVAARTAARTAERQKREEERTQRSTARTTARTAERQKREEERTQRSTARTIAREERTKKNEVSKNNYLEERASKRKEVVHAQYKDFVKNFPHLTEEGKKQSLRNLYTLYDAETQNHQLQMALSQSHNGGRRKHKARAKK